MLNADLPVEAYIALSDVVRAHESTSTLRYDMQLHKWRALDPTSTDEAELRGIMAKWGLM